MRNVGDASPVSVSAVGDVTDVVGGASEGAIVVVDGGGTKTDVAVLDQDGWVLARRRAGSFIPQAVGPDRAAQLLDAEVRLALDAAGGPAVALAGIYFSGLDFPFEVDAFRDALGRGCAWARTDLLVDNDTFAVLRVGTSEPTAVAVVCGTGMNCVGRGADGQQVRFAALGPISGDWGGGISLGGAALWHAARATDGRGPATVLLPLVVEALGRETMDAVIVDYHTGALDQEGIGALAPLIFEAACAGDEVAAGVVQRQADEIVAFAVAALTRLGALEQPCPVVLGGGVIAAGHEILLRAIENGLAARAPAAHMVVVSAPPLAGAALLAFDTLGANDQTLRKVRAAFAA